MRVTDTVAVRSGSDGRDGVGRPGRRRGRAQQVRQRADRAALVDPVAQARARSVGARVLAHAAAGSPDRR